MTEPDFAAFRADMLAIACANWKWLAACVVCFLLGCCA